MTVLELPERFLNKEKDLKKNISAITLEDETDKKSKSLFQTYSLNKDTLVDDTKVLELPKYLKKTLMSILRIILHGYMTNLKQILLMMFAMAGINHNQVSFI